MKVLFLFLLLLTSFAAAIAWPANGEVNINQSLSAGYEPSGIVWHPYYNSLFLVSDGGILSRMTINGSNVTNWNVAGDLEGVTITSANSEFVYVLVERPYAVIKFNPSTGQSITTVSLVGVIPAVTNTNSGPEGITFIPNGLHPYANSTNNGLFYIGVQETGAINVVDIDFNANTARLVASFTPVAGRGDIAGLNFNPESKTLSVLYDSSNLLREIHLNNTLIVEYSTVSGSEEGVTILPSCPNNRSIIVIADDAGRVLKYANYPVNCVQTNIDADGDGFFQNAAPLDCNDNNANVNPSRSEILYNGVDDDCNPLTLDTLDADADGFNSNVDCNDNNALINPGRVEIRGNGIDDDCNAATSDEPLPSAWPNGTSVVISQNLPAGYEPSGAVWHARYNSLFVVSDNGHISKMNLDGSNVTTWTAPGDLEGITITNLNSEFVYAIVEYPYALIKFNPQTGQTIRTVSLTGIVPATVNSGLGISGLTFVPNGQHPYANSTNEGLFYMSLEENGAVHVVDVNFNTGMASLIASFTPVPGRSDLEGMQYNLESKTLSLLYDGTSILREIYLNNTLIREYTVPGVAKEGIAILPSCPNAQSSIVIAEDGGRVVKYSNYPVNCNPLPIDQDNDGYFTNYAQLDCNDNNANVNPSRSEILYNGVDDDCNPLTLDTLDADADGFNSNVDCNDNNALINPGRVEVLRNGIDDDCNAATLDVPPIVTTIIEGENMTTLSGGSVRRLADSVAFYTNGYAQQSINLTNATYNITVLARADVVPNHNANLRITIDGTVIGNYVISSPTFVPVSFNRNLTTGNHTLKVQFTNDYYVANPRQDVNLYVDKITLTH